MAASNDNSNNNTQGLTGLLAERMAEGGGALINDQNGLCLGSQGDISTNNSGVYTSIAKLANMLDSTVDGSSGSSSNQQQAEVPLVSIQTEKAALLVKEYGGRTVVFRVPTEAENKSEGGSGDNEEGVGENASKER